MLDSRHAAGIIENDSQIHIRKQHMDTSPAYKTERRPEKAADSVKYRRFLAGTMAFVVLVTVMFSIAFTALESTHDCCGEDCHICFCIRECEKYLEQTRLGYKTDVRVCADALAVFLTAAVLCSETFISKGSPVSEKTRLNI